jgi:hypothetical protein
MRLLFFRLLALTTLSLAGHLPAHALPGQSYREITSWVHNHALLSPQLIGPINLMDYWQVTAFRELQDQVFIDIEFLFSSADNPGAATAKVHEEALTIVEKEPKNDKSEDELIFDPRPWIDKAYLAIWEPTNPKAHLVLERVYGAAVAQDFKNAQLLFQGNEYVEEAPTSYVRYPIEQRRYRMYIWGKDVKIFLGAQYGYEVSTVSLSGNTPDKVSLKIKSKAEALADVKTLQHNAREYEAYLRETEATAPRTTPAAIKLK